MKTVVHALMLATLLSVAACAGRRSDVVIDPAGVDMARYQRDLQECEEISQQVRGKAAGGAIGGAVVGGAIGSIVGGSDAAGKGAGVGAVTGTARGAAATRKERQLVVKNCLRNRGYSVLN